MATPQWTVERTTEIAAPADVVFEEIVDFRNWPHWSPWEDVDPDLRRTYSGADRGPGSVYTWAGNRKAGEGRMEVTGASEPDRVDVEVSFLKPFKARSDTAFVLTPRGERTHVLWTMTGTKTAAMKVMGLFTTMDKMIGPDFEKGLGRLKAYVEGGRTPAA